MDLTAMQKHTEFALNNDPVRPGRAAAHSTLDSTRLDIRIKSQKNMTVTVGRNRTNRNTRKTKLSKENPSPDGRPTGLAGRLCTALPATKKKLGISVCERMLLLLLLTPNMSSRKRKTEFY